MGVTQKVPHKCVKKRSASLEKVNTHAPSIFHKFVAPKKVAPPHKR